MQLVIMASSVNPRDTSANAPCLHPRLILETTTADRRYLTGHHVFEHCGLHFDHPNKGGPIAKAGITAEAPTIDLYPFAPRLNEFARSPVIGHSRRCLAP